MAGVVRVGQGAGVLAEEGLGDRPGQEDGQAPQEEGDDGQDHGLGQQESPAVGDGGQGGSDLTGGVLPGDDEGSQDRDDDLAEVQAGGDHVLGRLLALLLLPGRDGDTGAEQDGQGDGDEGGDPGRAQGPELDPLRAYGAQDGLTAFDAKAGGVGGHVPGGTRRGADGCLESGGGRGFHTGECFPAFFVLSKYSISTLSKFYFFINFLMKINSVFDINNNTN